MGYNNLVYNINQHSKNVLKLMFHVRLYSVN